MGRSTQGVTLISLDDKTFLASIEPVAESEDDMLLDEEMEAQPDIEAGEVEQGGDTEDDGERSAQDDDEAPRTTPDAAGVQLQRRAGGIAEFGAAPALPRRCSTGTAPG